MKGKRKPAEEAIINTFCEHLSGIGCEKLEVTDWPDASNPGDIDAIAKGQKSCLGIEHTSIDSFGKQREDSAGFQKVFGELENELRNEFPGFISVFVAVGAVKETRMQEKIKSILRKWLLENVPKLPLGNGEYEVPGLDFNIRIHKHESENNLFGFGRFSPEGQDLEARLEESIGEKSKKLQRYRKSHKTILLIESDDIALMEVGLMRDALSLILERGISITVDEIWFAHSCFEPTEFYKLWPV